MERGKKEEMEENQKKEIKKWICYLIASAGFAYQLYYITNIYELHELITENGVSYPETVTAPAISICSTRPDILDCKEMMKVNPNFAVDFGLPGTSTCAQIDQFFKSNTEIYEKLRQDAILFRNMTDKQVFKVLIKPEQFVRDCFITDQRTMKTKHVSCSSAFDMVMYFDHFRPCVAFNHKTNVTYQMHKVTKTRPVPNFLYQLELSKLLQRKTDALTIKFHESYKIPRDGHGKHVYLTDLTGNFISMTYNIYETKLLNYPRETRCKDYLNDHPDPKVVDRGTCENECMKREQVKFLGEKVSFPGIMVFRDEASDHRHINMRDFLKNDTLNEFFQMADDQCHEECILKSCTTTIYSPEIESSVKYPHNSILVYAHAEPMFTTTQSEKMTILDYIIYVSSCIGFWGGCSVVSTLVVLNSFGTTIKNCHGQRKAKRQRRKEFKSAVIRLANEINANRQAIVTFPRYEYHRNRLHRHGNVH